MPQSHNWPFKRIIVDHLFHGTTRIWWDIEPSFVDEGPYEFQLQAGYTSQGSALDWIDVGEPATNVLYLCDDTVREHSGKHQLTHYRVLMTTPTAKYISAAQGIWGVLPSQDWNLAREIIRKENLGSLRTDATGYLLRKFHYGAKSLKTTDTLTDEVIDSSHPETWGTAFKLGYHPPVSLSCGFSAETLSFYRGGDNIAKHNSRDDVLVGRISAIWDLFKEDVWVDGSTDQRYSIDGIKIVAAWRRVPLIYSVQLRPLPFSNIAYKIPIDPFFSYDPGEQPSTPGIGGVLGEDNQPTTGTGCVRVDENYECKDGFIYQGEDCCPIEGATILAFTKENWNGGARTEPFAAATSQTTTGGVWAWAMKLDPGEYILTFEKLGEYGPDVVCLTVQPLDTGPPPPDPYCELPTSQSSSQSNQSSSQSSQSSSQSDDGGGFSSSFGSV